MIRPTRAQCAMAYVANGDWPPLSLLVLNALVAGGITSALSIAFGTWIGGTL